MTSVLDALKSVQFVINAEGKKFAVQVLPTLSEVSQGGTAVFSQVETTQSNRALINAATQLAEPVFANVWNNPEDDIYNEL